MIQLRNPNQTSAKYWPNISLKSCLSSNFKILTKALKVWTKVKLCDQASASKSATNCCQLDPHHQLQQQKQPFELVSLHARVTSIKFTKREWVSEWVTDKARQRSDSGPIKTDTYTNTQQRSVKVAGLNYWTCSKASERLRDLKKKKSNLWKIKNMNCVNMLWMWKKSNWNVFSQTCKRGLSEVGRLSMATISRKKYFHGKNKFE